jgi:hypothetical protein
LSSFSADDPGGTTWGGSANVEGPFIEADAERMLEHAATDTL